jgi:hypothetical protein
MGLHTHGGRTAPAAVRDGRQPPDAPGGQVVELGTMKITDMGSSPSV